MWITNPRGAQLSGFRSAAKPRSTGSVLISLICTCPFLAVGLPAGCGGGGSPTSGDILVGHFASMTGSEATFGQSTDRGIRLAVDEINAAGGIHGRHIRLITLDDKGDSREAGTAVTRLITKEQVVAVLGEVSSGLSLAGAPVCQESGIPMISPSATSPRVTRVGDMIFSICFTDPFQGFACAKFAREHADLRAERAAILVDQTSPYSVGLQEEFEQAFQAMGGTVVSRQSYQGGDQDFSAQLTSIRAAAPDVLFLPGYYTDVGNIALQAQKLGLQMPLLGGDGWDSPRLSEIAGSAIEGAYFSNHYSHEDPRPQVQEFVQKYRERFAEVPDGLAALGYDAARILFQALQQAGSLAGTDLAAELAAVRDFRGVTGTISISPERNAVKPAVMLRMTDGKPSWVSTIQPE